MSSTTQPAASQNIDSILTETRIFPPPPEFSKNAHIHSKEDYDKICAQRRRRSGSLLGRHRARTALVQAVGQGAGVGLRRGRSGSWAARSIFRTTASTATSQTWRKNKAAIIWEGEPGEVRTYTYQQLLTEVKQVRQRAEVAGHQVGRSRRHLHGHVSRAADRHAGLRAHRRGALRHLRRILRQRAGRSHHRSGSGGGHHAGRLLSPRQRSEAESRGGRSAGPLSHREACGRATSAPAAKSPGRKAAITGGTS